MLLFAFASLPADILAAVRATTGLEWAAVLTGFACVWLAARESLWNFPIAIISCLLYVAIYHHAALYSDRNLQGLFIALSAYGWYEWLYGGRNKTPLAVTHTTSAEWLLSAAFAVAYTAGFGYYLRHHTDSAFPYLDSFTTGVSIVAQFLLMRKRLENWWLWILVDMVYVPILWAKHLYPTSLLYALYLALAIYGYWEWKKDAKRARVE
ncbi:nicotinamide riboside transporter PnuC [Hymenobacter sp. BRD67]|uniref:nicotinamide riboside transporter PnuC n=1 Tax=Hymenobacter sp. BRD67 TaxID=2675877 RepID=UPI0015642B5C|nr:nicotinamide riboside transporter PnuC [Hymenobacter sp. BRD67]QKG53681.1 nicotinamide mononucleotide transporter [Hymenobacter sp. BRD67]